MTTICTKKAYLQVEEMNSVYNNHLSVICNRSSNVVEGHNHSQAIAEDAKEYNLQ